jgi:hypothetical protein
MDETIALKVGEYQRLKQGIVKAVHLLYCGMPTKDSFSVAFFRSEGYQGYGINLYYPKDAKTITIDGVQFRVVNVTADQVTLQQYDIM